ncbi:MAG: serine hydrolase domain-containing protein [Candidatus Nanopelagicales bacterium]
MRGRTRASSIAIATSLVALLLASCSTGAGSPSSSPEPSGDPAQTAALKELTDSALAKYKQKSVIVRVVKDGVDLYTGAAGESMTGVPATPEMHTRNGAFAFTYIGQTYARMADQKLVNLDDPISKWLPDLRDASKVTIRNLLNMTSGYPDYVYQPAVQDGVQADPYKQWTDDEMIAVALARPNYFEPGTNWGYSHTNYVILGKLLSKITGKSTSAVLSEYVLEPMNLANTSSNAGTPAVPEPALHAFTSERRSFLKVPAKLPFYEEATFWNPSWTTANGAVQTSNIFDMTTSMEIVGSGSQVSPEMYQQQVAPTLVGFGKKDPSGTCPVCRELTPELNYGFGVVLNGDWITQTKSFYGSSASGGYLPSQKLTISVIANTAQDGFGPDGAYLNQNASFSIFTDIANLVAPGLAPPPRSG